MAFFLISLASQGIFCLFAYVEKDRLLFAAAMGVSGQMYKKLLAALCELTKNETVGKQRIDKEKSLWYTTNS